MLLLMMMKTTAMTMITSKQWRRISMVMAAVAIAVAEDDYTEAVAEDDNNKER